MGACISAEVKKTNNVTATTTVSPWQIMVQSHQGLYAALDHLKNTTMTHKRDAMGVIRKEADALFLLMKLHARIEDAVYFPAFNDYRPNIAGSFSDDHKRSAEGRPKLLELLDNAKNSDEAFEEGMTALRKFCDGNRAHQQKEEEVLDPFKPLFKSAALRDLFARIAALDAPSFNTTYVGGIYSHLPAEGKKIFIDALQEVVPPEQFVEISTTIQSAA